MSSPVSRAAAPLRVTSTRVSGRLPDFPWDTIADAKATAGAHADGIVDLSVGTPVDPVPALIRDALADNSTFPGYPTTIGTSELRRAAAESLARRHGVTALDETGILPVIGTKEAIAGLASTLGLGPGDDVVIPEVAYPTYEVSALLAGARPVRADSTVALGPMNPALMFINSPSNPTGKVLGLDHLRKVVGWARERGTVVVSDECYLGLSWQGEPLSILDPRVCDGDHTGLLAVHSLSKISNLASYRAGFFAGDPDLIGELLAVRKHAGLIVPFPIQGAMTAALRDDAHVDEQRERYAARRRLLKAAVEGAGFRVDHSEAGLYLWATRDEPCRETVDWLATRGILCAPGDFYGPAGERHVRMALTATDERISAAVARLAA
ncbi:succinyldiaminopimelate transaminase [Gordonia terrae]|uniref:Succinyldiaminopimelate transaminase n=2 Tax=Gordonia terrae TaxID=2055 RepID=A0AAD0KB58_9ACTN|nr:succinyldiaminopimelate transaminase [Gordonia terrae]VTR10676.1 aspartate/tyrosine/aromatic aminotransferase [Clostridioides difficile]ANY24273.1 succinyldiaminopimelate transaminase [Gordonia terrae]AWO85018.1 succinyldiaminopimelate transaminase [Gordonia terrae]VTS58051.1 LL-diaminopimelate aminotransferase [Gordonia terrae]GAB42488.1 succinyldiaminopimelate aminotransferase [Gordonia terrae NBRC 100016]